MVPDPVIDFQIWSFVGCAVSTEKGVASPSMIESHKLRGFRDSCSYMVIRECIAELRLARAISLKM